MAMIFVQWNYTTKLAHYCSTSWEFLSSILNFYSFLLDIVYCLHFFLSWGTHLYYVNRVFFLAPPPPRQCQTLGVRSQREIGSAEARGQRLLLGQLFGSIFCTFLFLVTSVGHFLGLIGSTHN